MIEKVVHVVLGYDKDSTNKIANLCEDDEKLPGTIFRSGQRRKVWLVTELGLYSILEQSRMPIARIWRRVLLRAGFTNLFIGGDLHE